jgi:hypothetical protein
MNPDGGLIMPRFTGMGREELGLVTVLCFEL